jgi:oligopeptide transport system substrate-binding protein
MKSRTARNLKRTALGDEAKDLKRTPLPDEDKDLKRTPLPDEAKDLKRTSLPDEAREPWAASPWSRRNFIKAATGVGSLVLVGGLLPTFLTACSNSTTATEATGGDTGAESGSGRALRLALSGEPGSLDVNYGFDGNSNTVINATTAGLFRIGEGGEVVPDLVDTYEKSADGLLYTFTLKKTTWTSGAAVTAHDFVYSWRRIADPAGGFGNAQQLSAAGIQNAAAILEGELPPDDLGVEALDDLTLQVTLERPVPYVERIFRNTNLRPIEQNFFEAQGANWATSPETHNACGPYRLSVYKTATPTIELLKNTGYHAADSIPFDSLIFQVITDSTQALLAFQSGELDVLELSGEQVEIFKEDPTFHSELRPQLFYIALNTIIPGLDYAKVRQALSFVIDKESLVDNVLKNGSRAAYYFVPWDFAFDSTGTDFRELSGDYQKLDVAKGQQLWEEAKQELGVEELTFSVVMGEDDQSQKIGEYVQAQIQNALPGIHLELTPVPDKVWYEELEKREWGLDNDWWWGEYPDAVANLMLFTSSSPYNFSGYGNEEFDEILRSVDTLPLAANESERLDALVRAEQIILEEDVALLPLYQAAQGYLSNPELVVPFGQGMVVLEDIKVK